MDPASLLRGRARGGERASAGGLCHSETSSQAVHDSRQPAKLLSLWRFLIVATALASGLKLVAGSPRRFEGSNASGHPASGATALDFSIRLKDGQTRFRQGETITLELGRDTDPLAAVSRLATDQDRPGLAVDEFRLQPRTGVVDPLRDFLGSVGVWSGPPPRPEPFIEEQGPSTAVDINEWFRFDKLG